MTTTSLNHRELGLVAQLEALLFVAPGAISIAQLATTLGITAQELELSLSELDAHYLDNSSLHGLRVQIHHGHVQLTTAPESAQVIEQFLNLEAYTRLSRAALETLAIIAYQEPVTRPQIDSIRGVNSDGVLKSLLSKGLIQDIGRAESPGRPILYSVTTDFLQHFGLSSLSELPPLDEDSHERIQDIELTSLSLDPSYSSE